MYIRRLQLVNYGPVPEIDIQFPFEGEMPKPVVLVGENGSGKSIVLSHIVNGLMSAKSSAFPDTPEVDTGKVYKLRSGLYIRRGETYYLARVQFDNDMSVGEVWRLDDARQHAGLPREQWSPELQALWRKMPKDRNDYFESSFSASGRFANDDSEQTVRDMLTDGCVLYFPFNRFEEPAWLNEESLKGRVRRVQMSQLAGHTSRTIVATSPLRENCDWLFDVTYDMLVAERQTYWDREQATQGQEPVTVLRERMTFEGQATASWQAALMVLREIVGEPDARFTVGDRRGRALSVETGNGQFVSSVFQLSSGECALLNLFLTILRDADLSGATLSGPDDLRGIVLVDEIDLHLHVHHQRRVLPKLMRMFPKVQFVVTTHSPLFVLGMRDVFGANGVDIYSLPEGRQIDAEEFVEFDGAYQAFADTQRARRDVSQAIESTRAPIVFLEGPTDVQYTHKAASVLEREELLQRVALRAAGNDSKLDKIWQAHANVMRVELANKIILMYDCDALGKKGRVGAADQGHVYRRFIPKHDSHPVAKGIENLFAEATLKRAMETDDELFVITPEHPRHVGTERRTVPEQWEIPSNTEKQALCDILCEIGDEKDFAAFADVLDMIAEIAER